MPDDSFEFTPAVKLVLCRARQLSASEGDAFIRLQHMDAALGEIHSPVEAVECEDRVIAKIRARRAAGLAKYGVSMERADLDRLAWLRHAQEEAMDLAVYLEKLISMEAGGGE